MKQKDKDKTKEKEKEKSREKTEKDILKQKINTNKDSCWRLWCLTLLS